MHLTTGYAVLLIRAVTFPTTTLRAPDAYFRVQMVSGTLLPTTDTFANIKHLQLPPSES